MATKGMQQIGQARLESADTGHAKYSIVYILGNGQIQVLYWGISTQLRLLVKR